MEPRGGGPRNQILTANNVAAAMSSVEAMAAMLN